MPETSSTKTVDEITVERGAVYGPFGKHADISQSIQRTFRDAFLRLEQRSDLDREAQAAIREGVAMIAHKLGRLANGDISHLDSWDDIAGYARITAREIRRSRGEEVEY